MKKIISLIMALSLLSTFVFAADFGGGTGYDKDNNKITVTYTGYANEEMTVLVYDVTDIEGATKETLFDSLSQTPVVGIDQSVATGSFDIPLASGFTGKVVIVLGGETANPVRMLLVIENSEITEIVIPDAITEDFDAQGTKRVLGVGESITIANGAKLMNAIIDARQGTFKIGDTTVTGVAKFNAKGQIDTVLGEIVKLVSAAAEDGTTNNGFIKKDKINKEMGSYTVTLTASGTDSNGTDFTDKTHEVVFNFEPIYSGEANFNVIVKNVPAGVTITAQ